MKEWLSDGTGYFRYRTENYRRQGDNTFRTETPRFSLPTGHALELGREIIHDIQHFHDMLETKSLSSTQRKRIGGSCCVLHLPPIDISLCEFHKLFLRDAVVRADFDASFLQEGCPDLSASRNGERTEVEGDVNTREECLIECFDAISGHEQDSRVVFEVTQETSYHRISLQVMQASLLQENICFINEHNGLPSSSEFYFVDWSRSFEV